MKIAQIIPSLAPFGPIFVAYNLTEALRKLGNIVDIYYFDEKTGIDFGEGATRIHMDKSINFNDYDIIHSHGFRPDKYVHNFRKQIKTAKTVSTIHQNIFHDFKSLYGLGRALLYTPYWCHFIKSKNAIVPISSYIRSCYANTFKTITPHIYNGVQINYNPSEQISSIKDQIIDLKNKVTHVVGLYAVINKRKRIDQIINLLKKREDLGLLIIGDGPEKESLQELSKGISDRVIFNSALYHPYNYLENIDVFLMLSSSEGFGLALIEAIATKTPTVCSDIPVMRELVTESETSFFELDNLYSLSNAIDRSIENKDALVESAYSKYLQKYSIESMVNGYIHLYSQLIQQH